MAETEKIRILIVDDIADTRDNLAKLIGFEPDMEVAGTADGGQAAVNLAKKERPHVILMDINMPDMDGITATEIISNTVPESPIIMMSVQGEQDYLRRSMLAGAREFLVKPFSADELINAIRHVHELEKVKRARYAAAAPAAGVGRAHHRREHETCPRAPARAVRLHRGRHLALIPGAGNHDARRGRRDPDAHDAGDHEPQERTRVHGDRREARVRQRQGA